MVVRVQTKSFELGEEVAALTQGRIETGAVVTFTGLCRGKTGADAISAMTLECYEAMAIAELEALEGQARARWSLDDVLIIHRHGRLTPGEVIVLVVTLSAHRKDAFAAAEFLMDFLKTQAPFWKKEEGPQGESWVAAKEDDDAAKERWQ
jgi:molybdopterin synthase catalytic subunit